MLLILNFQRNLVESDRGAFGGRSSNLADALENRERRIIKKQSGFGTKAEPKGAERVDRWSEPAESPARIA